MSAYEIKYNTVSVSNPWAAFNEAAKKRQENPELSNEQIAWPYQSEEDNGQTVPDQQESLINENQDNRTTHDEISEQENASESEDYENRESESSSIYDDPEAEADDSEYLPYDGPEDYITDVFDIKNVNPAVEDAIAYFNESEEGATRKPLRYKMELAAIKELQREKYYYDLERAKNSSETSDKEALDKEASDEETSDTQASDEETSDTEASDEEASDEDASESDDCSDEIPLPPYNPLFDEIRQKRSERRLQFGTTRVIRFKGKDIVAKNGSKVPKDKLPGKSILKAEEDQFVTPNYDLELIGDSKLFKAIARLYNLCDMPLECLDNTAPVHSVENLTDGFVNTLRSQEICWKRMSDEAVRVRDEALKKYEEEMKALGVEKDALDAEVVELKEKLWAKEIELQDEARENRINLSLLEQREKELKQVVTQMEVMKLDLLQVRSTADQLQGENDALRQELKNSHTTLQEQKKAARPLRIQIKELEARLAKEQKQAVESQQKLTFLERYRSESFVLQKRIEDLEDSNRKLVGEREKLQEQNEDLLRNCNHMKNTLTLTIRDLEAFKRREVGITLANKDLARQLEESNANVRRLVDTNTAYKEKFHLKYQEFEKKYAQVEKDCNNRRKEIEKAKLEMEKMGESLKETREEMCRNRVNNTVSICSENMVVHEPPIDVSTDQSSHVKGRRRLFQSLTNRFYSSPPVISVGEV